MSASLPKISIVTPSYNQGHYLEKAILSVLNQNYPNLEYIIIDGGSTDASVGLIKKYAGKITYWESCKDRGQSHAINKGFERATGDIFTWLNSDDYLMPGALHTMASAFSKHPEAGAISGRCELVNNSGDSLGGPLAKTSITLDSLYRWLQGNYFMQPSCFFTAEIWRKVGPLREDLFFCLDLDLWIKIAKVSTIVPINTYISKALIHPDAKTTAYNERMQAETILLILEHGARDIAREEAFRFADKLFENHNRMKVIKKNFFFRWFLYPFLRTRLKRFDRKAIKSYT